MNLQNFQCTRSFVYSTIPFWWRHKQFLFARLLTFLKTVATRFKWGKRNDNIFSRYRPKGRRQQIVWQTERKTTRDSPIGVLFFITVFNYRLEIAESNPVFVSAVATVVGPTRVQCANRRRWARLSRWRHSCQERITRTCWTTRRRDICPSTRPGGVSSITTNNTNSTYIGGSQLLKLPSTKFKHSFWSPVAREPCHSRCHGLILLETFTTLSLPELIENLPPFLTITQEVTGDPAFSMYNLALRYVVGTYFPVQK